MKTQFEAHILETQTLIQMFKVRLITAAELYQMIEAAELFLCGSNGGDDWNALNKLVAQAKRLAR
jgi:vancomycin permeability regulator SanA